MSKYEDYLKDRIKSAEGAALKDELNQALYKYVTDTNPTVQGGDLANAYEQMRAKYTDAYGNYSYDMVKKLTDGGYYTDGGVSSYMTNYENGRIYVTGKNPEGYGNGGAGQTPTSTPSATSPMTYEQWKSSGSGDNSYAGQRKNATYAQAEAARAEAERLAEIERKRAVVDADTLEKQQRATYGQMAEQMGAMGLTGSGYSDYINSGAYAAGMAARQNANAKAAEAKQNASYAEYMAKLEADKQYATEKELAEKEAEALKRQYAREAANARAEEQTKYSNFINSIPEGATSEP